MALSVKAFLDRPLGKNQEIRRFSIYHPITLATLKEKIVSVFPDIKTQDAVKIFWKDDEGDLIAATSDEELLQALRFMEKDLLKIYIKECRERRCQQDTSQGPLHHGVVCNGCNGAVFGVRYKCSVCPDYDLCSQCLEKGFHPEHPKTRIEISVYPSRHFTGAGPAGPPEGVWSPQMQQNFMRHWRRWMQRFGGQQKQQGQKQSDQGEKPKQETDGQQQGQGQPQYNVGEEYLKTMGEAVAAMLDPLGIDVIIDVETPSGRQRVNATKPAGSTQTAQPGMSKAESSQAPETETKTSQAPNPMDITAETGEMSRQTINLMEFVVKKEGSPNHREDSGWMLLNPAEEVKDVKKTIENKIDSSLHKMIEMGFENDGGWLRSLLEAKGGEIDAALDAIKPRVA